MTGKRLHEFKFLPKGMLAAIINFITEWLFPMEIYLFIQAYILFIDYLLLRCFHTGTSYNPHLHRNTPKEGLQ